MRSVCAFILCAAFAASSARPAAAADYRTQPGDVIEVAVGGLPGLQQRVRIQLDGTISLPLLGTVVVAGLTAAQLRARIELGLANKIYRLWTNDGREATVVVRPDEISANIIDYRPITVSGDVVKPGEVGFSPGMTVRAAVALAGGFGVADLRTPDLALQAAELRGESQSLWLEAARTSAHADSLTAELAGRDSFAASEPAESPLPQQALKQIDQLESQDLGARAAAYRHEAASLQSAIGESDSQIAVFAKLEKEEEQGTSADEDDLQKVIQLYGRGMLTSSRVNDARRALLFSSTRALQATAELLTLRRQREDAVERLQRFNDERRIQLLKELQDSELSLNDLRARRAAIAERLRLIARASDDALGQDARAPEVSIFRAGAQGDGALSVGLDAALQPGDLIEVRAGSPGSDVAVR